MTLEKRAISSFRAQLARGRGGTPHSCGTYPFFVDILLSIIAQFQSYLYCIYYIIMTSKKTCDISNKDII